MWGYKRLRVRWRLRLCPSSTLSTCITAEPTTVFWPQLQLLWSFSWISNPLTCSLSLLKNVSNCSTGKAKRKATLVRLHKTKQNRTPNNKSWSKWTLHICVLWSLCIFITSNVMKIQSLPMWHKTTLCRFSSEVPWILPMQMATESQWSWRQTALSGLLCRGEGTKRRLPGPSCLSPRLEEQLPVLVRHSRIRPPVLATLRFLIKPGYTFENSTLHVSSTHLFYIFNIMYELWEHLVFCKFGQIQLHLLFQTCPRTWKGCISIWISLTLCLPLSDTVLCDFKLALYLNFKLPLLMEN